jgi:Uma2 family endonuclease
MLYPESDGQPMAENTLQFQWIVTIKENLEALFEPDPNVFVAGDLFWYPVEGEPIICQAPDTLVVFGRPKGHRGSYRQWEEDGIAPQVVFEIRSPGNRYGDMVRRFGFYERYGVEEYYVFDPEYLVLEGWRRAEERLREIPEMNGWVSPRLGIRFQLKPDGLTIFRPDGQPFLTFVELERQRQLAVELASRVEKQLRQAEQQVQEAKQRAAEAEQRADRLAEKLRQLGVPPESKGP